jgi:lipopolysaccharide/colanic/teichoic acid biosynthesis glycosyltransferase
MMLITRRLTSTLQTRSTPTFPVAIWLTVGLVITQLLASFSAWNDFRIWNIVQTPDNARLVALTVLACVLPALLSRRLSRFPQADSPLYLVALLIASFLIELGLIALGRWYYSRNYLLVSFVLMGVWHMLGDRLDFSNRPQIAIVPGGMATQLLNLPRINWTILNKPHFVAHPTCIVVDLEANLTIEWRRFLTEASLRDVNILHAAAILEAATGQVNLNTVYDGLLERFRYRDLYGGFKRLLDVVIVMAALPALLIVAAVVALLIRLDSRGPVLFFQNRAGLGGKPFRMVKFRTMTQDAERQGQQLATLGDARVTRIGRVLRKYRFDEIPQFWNVLCGHMSIIGPRPEQVTFAERFASEVPFYGYRHLVRPGLTGWAQVCQGYAGDLLETKRKLEYDLYYVKHLSLWFDLLIVLKTISVVLSGFGSR